MDIQYLTGVYLSNIVSIQIEVKNEKENGGDIPGFELIVFLAALSAVMWVRKRRK